MARSSAKAIWRAASFAGCQSESFGAALDIVDLLAIELEGHAQLDQRLHLALPRENAVAGRRDRRRWPVPTAESATPAGPCTSTTRRPAR